MGHRGGGGHRDAGYRRDCAPVQLGRRSHVLSHRRPPASGPGVVVRDSRWAPERRGCQPYLGGRAAPPRRGDAERGRSRPAGEPGEGGGRVTARYLIDAALDRPDTISERRAWAKEVERAERVMRTVATNVNQLARLARSTGRIPEGTGETLTAVREASAALMAMPGRPGTDRRIRHDRK